MMMNNSLSRRGLMHAGLVLSGGVIILDLTGCTVLSHVDTPTPLYDLKPDVDLPAGLPKVSWQLVVSEPDADADLDTSRIALRRKNNVTEYFADADWVDTAPRLVQSKLLEAFEKSDCVQVGRDVSSLVPDYVLQIELRDFQAEYGGAVTGAHVRIAAKMVRMADRKIVTTINAEQRAEAVGTDMTQVISAFQKALGPVLTQIVVGTLKAVPENSL